MFKKKPFSIKNSAPELGLPNLYSEDDCAYVVAEENEYGEFISLGVTYYFKNLEQYEKECEKYDASHSPDMPFDSLCDAEKCLISILCAHENYLEALDDCHLGPHCGTNIYGLEPEAGSDAIVTVDGRTVVILRITKINMTVIRNYDGEYDSDIDYDFTGVTLDSIRSDVANGKLPKSVLKDIEEILRDEFEDSKNVFSLPELPDDIHKDESNECVIPRTINLNAEEMEAEYQKTHDWDSVFAIMNMD